MMLDVAIINKIQNTNKKLVYLEAKFSNVDSTWEASIYSLKKLSTFQVLKTT